MSASNKTDTRPVLDFVRKRGSVSQDSAGLMIDELQSRGLRIGAEATGQLLTELIEKGDLIISLERKLSGECYLRVVPSGRN